MIRYHSYTTAGTFTITVHGVSEDARSETTFTTRPLHLRLKAGDKPYTITATITNAQPTTSVAEGEDGEPPVTAGEQVQAHFELGTENHERDLSVDKDGMASWEQAFTRPGTVTVTATQTTTDPDYPRTITGTIEIPGAMTINVTRETMAINITRDEITIQCAADTFVRGGNGAGENYGNDPHIFVKAVSGTGFSQYTRIGLLRFDVPELGGSHYTEARLKVYMTRTRAGSDISIHAVTDEWVESELTWSTPGGNPYWQDAIATTISSSGPLSAVPEGEWVEFDLSEYWRTSEGDSHLSIAVFTTVNDNQEIKIHSRQNDSGNYPILLLS
ncbi:DNRLRE domain-containing protein [Streptomyces sp. H27-G5]|uniref:CBM96 family carbohydrate-binding protein n=1 Tax=Streptomyces sp. H27-G5 TaxID=2996698 RepID=UPI0022706AFF|nr:DNRLRE domain-containing protein [Streptomyces sp. H27-G5]MCY0924317.1 DNRLRE domain-containing protein [Streptomyces sp. H27-G5]